MKPILLKVPADEAAAFAAVLARYPGASPQLIIRALVLTSPPLWITNALAKHAALKVKGGFGEKEK